MNYSPREKASPLTIEQKRTLVALIAEHRAILDKKCDHDSIAKKKEAWNQVAEDFNAAYPLAESRNVTQLKRAWEYTRSKVGKEYSEYVKIKRTAGGGPHPTPSNYDALDAAALLDVELKCADRQYDNSCRDVGLTHDCDASCALEAADVERITITPDVKEEETSTSGESDLEDSYSDFRLQAPTPPDDTCTAPEPSSPTDPSSSTWHKAAEHSCRGKKRKPQIEKEECLKRLKESHSDVNEQMIQMMQEKHQQEMVSQFAFQKMCTTVTKFFDYLLEKKEDLIK